MKKQILKSALIAVAGVGLMAGSALAVPGASLQTVFDNITTNPLNNSSVDVTTDFLSDAYDSYWSIGGAGGSVSTIVVEIAGFAGQNTFGIYDAANFTNFVQIFDGPASTGAQKLVSILADGSVVVNFVDTGVDFAGNSFGYYLNSSANSGGGLFYSDTSLNTDQFDHMYAYEGGNGDSIQVLPFAAGPWSANEFILAWEDLAGGGDQDFTDFVVIVESVTPIPEPTTMLLFGTGLLGLAAAARRRKNS